VAEVRPKTKRPTEASKQVEHMPEAPGVYLLTHKRTGEMYVGQSGNMRSRCRTHLSTFPNGCACSSAFSRLRDRGCKRTDLILTVLECCPVARLNIRERFWMRLLNPSLNGVGAPKKNKRRAYRMRP
jgi:hypothetical protein